MLVLNTLFSPILRFCIVRILIGSVANDLKWEKINITVLSLLIEYINKLSDIYSGFRVLIFDDQIVEGN